MPSQLSGCAEQFVNCRQAFVSHKGDLGDIPTTARADRKEQDAKGYTAQSHYKKNSGHAYTFRLPSELRDRPRQSGLNNAWELPPALAGKAQQRLAGAHGITRHAHFFSIGVVLAYGACPSMSTGTSKKSGKPVIATSTRQNLTM